MMRWEWCTFSELGVHRLYAIIQLRVQVFVVEQTCAYQETDGLDHHSMHLMGWQDDRLLAYARVLPLDLYQPGVVSIGRIVVAKKVRGMGLGRQLVEKCLNFLAAKYDNAPVKIAAQHRLEDFYRSFGFETVGDPYIEDGILHVAMVRAGE